MDKLETMPSRGRRSSPSWLAAPALAMGLALAAASAQAGDVYWSLGMQAPGMVLGASNAAPVYVAPSPVVVYPAPRVVYPAPQVVVPPPVYGLGWMPPGQYKHRWKHHGDDWREEGWRGRGGWGHGRRWED